VVEGAPVVAGRPRTDFARRRVYEPKLNARYRKLVQKQWDVQHPGFEPFARYVPLRLDTVFFLERPGTHLGTGRNAGKLKDWAPRFPTGENADFDNLVKLLADALTKRAWYGDGQIVEGRQRKLFVTESHPLPCTVATITSLA
jgi:Holliday junction resolvase RusA-like endonuclease